MKCARVFQRIIRTCPIIIEEAAPSIFMEDPQPIDNGLGKNFFLPVIVGLLTVTTVINWTPTVNNTVFGGSITNDRSSGIVVGGIAIDDRSINSSRNQEICMLLMHSGCDG